MKKQDLKTGMILEFNDGDKAMVLLDTQNGDIFSGMTWGYIDELNDDLEQKINPKGWYVTKIYQSNNSREYLYHGVKSEYCKILWRKPNKVYDIHKRLMKKQNVTEDMFAKLSPREMMELSALLIQNFYQSTDEWRLEP